MTIEKTAYSECNFFVKPSQRTFYPSKIPPQHYQLKHFISIKDPDVIYFASRNQVYALHRSLKKRRLIATLPWEPQCLGAGHGWIGVGGGEKGRCAFIKVGVDDLKAGNWRASLFSEVDALLPLDLDPESRMLARDFLHQRRIPLSSRRRPSYEEFELGKNIVNSIVIDRLKDKDGNLEDPVAILTNNDGTVRFFSLPERRIIQTLGFPTQMNHATISPNKDLMVAVGDDPRAFFCKRQQSKANGSTNSEWCEIAQPKLSAAATWDMCFSTAFSPSGHLCAVASQTGTITIFDTRLIHEDMETDEAVIDVLESSRPCIANEDGKGAIRSMSFSPQPWDLFAWAEDRGRVCVTDLRNNFRSRQTMEIEISASNVKQAELDDYDENMSIAEERGLEAESRFESEERGLEIEARFEQRHREALAAQDHLAAVNHTADYIEHTAERWRLLRQARDSGQRASVFDPMPGFLSETERQVMEALRQERQRENERDAERREATQHPFSIHYRRSSTSTPGTQARESGAASSSSTSQPTRSASINQYIRDRYLDRNRPSDRTFQPRRRSSVVMSNSNPSDPSSSSHPSSLVPIGTTTATLTASPSRLSSTIASTSASTTIPIPSTSTISTTILNPSTSTRTPATPDPWQTISAAMLVSTGINATRLSRESEAAAGRTTFERGMLLMEQQMTRPDRLMRLERLNWLQQRVGEAAFDPYELELLRQADLRDSNRLRDEGNLAIMGIGWSEDGRLL
ncbi:MAG: hypothetical protein MMC33_004399 [Icmadophila ericetorum]|nr:hypothetical protein [Icmadophila ericetorum]